MLSHGVRLQENRTATSLPYEHTLSAQKRKIFKGTQLECRYTQSQKPVAIELWTGKKIGFLNICFIYCQLQGQYMK